MDQETRARRLALRPLHDDERKLQPDIADWQHLSEHARDKGRDAVQALPQILADAGYQMVPSKNA
ncbi:hypothetical protein ABZ801_01365 [Actinomadura sp. NPDC047616]|uniref:hypothetical protein n=1 Tax=Actinomadura sp. NPDC047616 TaxID=3155914 RepID=UPI0033F642AC